MRQRPPPRTMTSTWSAASCLMKPSTFSTASCGAIKYGKKALIDAITASIVVVRGEFLERRVAVGDDGELLEGGLATHDLHGVEHRSFWWVIAGVSVLNRRGDVDGGSISGRWRREVPAGRRRHNSASGIITLFRFFGSPARPPLHESGPTQTRESIWGRPDRKSASRALCRQRRAGRAGPAQQQPAAAQCPAINSAEIL